jgi:hypothetical protein
VEKTGEKSPKKNLETMTCGRNKKNEKKIGKFSFFFFSHRAWKQFNLK